MHTAAAWALPVTQICLIVFMVSNFFVWRSTKKIIDTQDRLNDEVMKAILNLSQELIVVQRVLAIPHASRSSFRADA